MSKDQKATDEKTADRRSFLKLAGAGAITGGAAIAGGTAAAAAEPAQAPSSKALYRETEHVRRYYELARKF